MILIPVNTEELAKCLVIAVGFEVLRIIIAFLLARPSSKANVLEVNILETQTELRKIKSVQLEFVKNSKLERQLIKYEKELELIQITYAPKALRVKKIARITRVRLGILRPKFNI